MSEIPEDILKAAAEIAEPRHIAPRKQDLANEIALAILAEREAERERCAKIAETYPYHSPFYANTPSLDAKIRSGQSVASGEIATAIRNPKP